MSAALAIRAATVVSLLAASQIFAGQIFAGQVFAGQAPVGSLACEREMTRAAAETGVPLNVLYSVGLTETGGGGKLGAYDLNVDGRAVHADTLREALARVAAAQAQGARFIDVGCMQINIHFHGSRFASLAAMFDPAGNVDYAANLLKALKAETGAWTLAVARYNAGPGKPEAERRYVCSVIRNMVASGFGRWTESARRLCL